MGKKNRNRGSGRGRYDDMFDYAGGNDDDYQYSYQDEIDSAEFVDVENSQKDSRNRENMPSTERNAKSLAAEERESWDFIKAKMDQSLSKLGGGSTSSKKSEKREKSSADSSKEEKKPKGPNPVVVFFGKAKTFFSSSFQKIRAACKRKPKPEGEEKKTADSSRTEAQKQPGAVSKTFSFLKKKSEPLADTPKAARPKNDARNSSGNSGSRDSKPTAETLLRKRRKTYLIIGSLTMCIVLLFLTAGILFLVNRSGKSGKPVAQNTETSESTAQTETSPNDELPLPITATTSDSNSREPEKETVPPALDSELDLPDLPEDLAKDLDSVTNENAQTDKKSEKKNENTKSNKEDKTGKTENELPTVDDLLSDLTVGDVVNSDTKNTENATDPLDSLDSLVNEGETKPAEETDSAKTPEKEEKAEDPLADLGTLSELDTSDDASKNPTEPDGLSDLPSLTDDTSETTPSGSNDSINSSMQEETPSLNETALPETGEKDSSSDSSPALLDLPESVSPGSATVSPTLSRSEDQNQLPEEMGTPDGVSPGSNVDAWNTPGNTEVTDPAANETPAATLDLPTDPLAETSPTKESKPEGLGLGLDLDENTGKKEEKSSAAKGLDDLSQLDGLNDTPLIPALDSNLGRGNDLIPPPEASKEQKGAKYTNYTSLKDDTFWKISEKFYQTPAYEKALSRYNIDVVPDPNNLKEGTVLQIPDVNFLRSCYPTLCPQPLQVVQVPASQNSDQTRGVQYYCAVEGDTLSLIAERLLGDSSRWPEIYRMNASKIKEMDLVPAGVKLMIPADETIPEQNIWQ